MSFCSVLAIVSCPVTANWPLEIRLKLLFVVFIWLLITPALTNMAAEVVGSTTSSCALALSIIRMNKGKKVINLILSINGSVLINEFDKFTQRFAAGFEMRHKSVQRRRIGAIVMGVNFDSRFLGLFGTEGQVLRHGGFHAVNFTDRAATDVDF